MHTDVSIATTRLHLRLMQYSVCLWHQDATATSEYIVGARTDQRTQERERECVASACREQGTSKSSPISIWNNSVVYFDIDASVAASTARYCSVSDVC